MLLNEILKGKRVILGSASPRRHELLAGLGIDFTVDTGNTFVEAYPADMPHKEIPEYLSKGKSYGFHRELMPDEILITADTMVFCGKHALGKPKERKEAVEMLRLLQNNSHIVLTGVTIRSVDKCRSFTVSSKVYFSHLSNEEIDYYIDTKKPYDKAGSYGVQEWIGFVAIKKIEGSYFNVMGLPVQRLYTELKKFAR